MKSITGISKGSKYLLTILILFILIFLPISCGAEEEEKKEEEESALFTYAPDLQDITIINEVNPDEVDTCYYQKIKSDLIEISWSGEYIIQKYNRCVVFLFEIPTNIIEEGVMIKIEEEEKIYGKDAEPHFSHSITILSKNSVMGFLCVEGEIVFEKAEKEIFGYMKGEMKNLNCINPENRNKKLMIKSLKFDGKSGGYDM